MKLVLDAVEFRDSEQFGEHPIVSSLLALGFKFNSAITSTADGTLYKLANDGETETDLDIAAVRDILDDNVPYIELHIDDSIVIPISQIPDLLVP